MKNSTQYLGAIALVGAGTVLASLGGCAYEGRQTERAQTGATQQQTETTTIVQPTRTTHETVYVHDQSPQQVIVVREAPPAPEREIIIERDRPSRQYVWVNGYYRADGPDSWTWTPGHWEAPPSGTTVWVAPRYERVSGGYRYIPGGWR